VYRFANPTSPLPAGCPSSSKLDNPYNFYIMEGEKYKGKSKDLVSKNVHGTYAI
jgi:hypothetical protein